jgi:hypothetical protein
MKHLVPKEKRKVELNFPNLDTTARSAPIIYIRYWNDEVIYIGESTDFYSGRHLRYKCRPHSESDDKTNFVRVLNAPENTAKRRKWEAKLVCWLNPKLQKVNMYIKKAGLDYELKRNLEILKNLNDIKAQRRIATSLTEFLRAIKMYKKRKIKDPNVSEDGVLNSFDSLEKRKHNYHNFKEVSSSYGKELKFFPLNKRSLDLIDKAYNFADTRMGRILNNWKETFNDR